MEDLLALAATPQAWAALATLVVMEVVLGIDNLIFISILTNKLPEHQRSRARRVGIGLAVILRLGLLASVAIIAQLTQPLFSLFDHGFSWRDLILIAADPLARFIGNNPTIVMLALGFLLLIGGSLLAEGMGVHVPKGYIYAAMAFSALIEGLNMLARRRRKRPR